MDQLLTFVIPIRIDSIERKENLLTVIESLKKNLSSKVILMEADHQSGFKVSEIKKLASKGVDFNFVYDANALFHRTRYLNKLLDLVKTPLVAIWDADVIIPYQQIVEAIKMLTNEDIDFVFPYDGRFYDTGEVTRKKFLSTVNTELLLSEQFAMSLPYGYNSVGGAFLANVCKYKQAGGENENFHAWGIEDGERVRRWEILNLKVKRVWGPLFHLTHPRGINSTFASRDQKINAFKEVVRIVRMDTPELEQEVRSWNRNFS